MRGREDAGAFGGNDLGPKEAELAVHYGIVACGVMLINLALASGHCILMYWVYTRRLSIVNQGLLSHLTDKETEVWI